MELTDEEKATLSPSKAEGTAPEDLYNYWKLVSPKVFEQTQSSEFQKRGAYSFQTS